MYRLYHALYCPAPHSSAHYLTLVLDVHMCMAASQPASQPLLILAPLCLHLCSPLFPQQDLALMDSNTFPGQVRYRQQWQPLPLAHLRLYSVPSFDHLNRNSRDAKFQLAIVFVMEL